LLCEFKNQNVTKRFFF